jgi:cytochrome bd-type quinol oxidase subunit 2
MWRKLKIDTKRNKQIWERIINIKSLLSPFLFTELFAHKNITFDSTE